MGALQNQTIIDKNQLSEDAYLQSLVMEARRAGLLTDKEFQRLQLQVFSLLAEVTVRYTKGESASVRVETAQTLLGSILFTLGIYLKRCPNPEDALKQLELVPLPELYERGRQALKSQISLAKNLFQLVKKSRVETKLFSYQFTIQAALPPFFTAYDPEFAAQDATCSIDYFLIHDLRLDGITFILRYLQGLLLENQFCQLFSGKQVDAVLRGYDEEFEELIINLYERVLTNALGCVLLGKDPHDLMITGDDRQQLQQRLDPYDIPQLEQLFSAACQKLFKELEITSKNAQAYAISALNLIAAAVHNGLDHQALSAVFVTPVEVKQKIPYSLN